MAKASWGEHRRGGAGHRHVGGSKVGVARH